MCFKCRLAPPPSAMMKRSGTSGSPQKFQRLKEWTHVAHTAATAPARTSCLLLALDAAALDLIIEFIPQRKRMDVSDLADVSHSLLKHYNGGRSRLRFVGVILELGLPLAQELVIKVNARATVLHVHLRHLQEKQGMVVNVCLETGKVQERRVAWWQGRPLFLKRVEALLRSGIMLGGGPGIKIVLPTAGRLPVTCLAMSKLQGKRAEARLVHRKKMCEREQGALQGLLWKMWDDSMEEVLCVVDRAFPQAATIERRLDDGNTDHLFDEEIIQMNGERIVRLKLDTLTAAEQRGLWSCARRLL